jgi:hypothetical protein
MPYSCHLCKKEYPKMRGLKSHLHFCKAHASWTSHLKHALEDCGLELASNAAKRTRFSSCANSGDEDFSSESVVSDASNPEILQAFFFFNKFKVHIACNV